jgi:hypothetical protein
MKLWLVTRSDYDNGHVYDCADAFVIRAESSDDARMIASKNCGVEGGSVWLRDDKSICEELLQSGKPGLILTDFHAG